MSEYWKSTPKYWCKFCQAFVRDTPLEKKQHDATPKHQGNIQRSLRELHKGQERDAREKQRAKDEVARLNGLVPSGHTVSASSSSGTKPKPTVPVRSAPVQATAEERKRQMQQLAAMGVAVPQEFRKDMAVAGEWSTVSETPIYRRPVKDEFKEEDDDEDKEAMSSFGVRKRKIDDEDEGLEAARSNKRNWGSSLKAYPGSKVDDTDLDALLAGSATKKDVVKSEEPNTDQKAGLKKENSGEVSATLAAIPAVDESVNQVKQEEDPVTAPVVFKKRKAAKR